MSDLNNKEESFSDSDLSATNENEQPPVGDGIDTTQTANLENTTPFGDLPFKSNDEIVRAYKEIQRAYTEGRTQYHELKRSLTEIAPLLKQMQEDKGRTPVEAEGDVARALNDFIQNGPHKTFDSHLEKNLNRHLKSTIDPLQRELAQLRAEREVDKREKELDRFLSDHPEITESDEDKILHVIKTTPWIKSMGGSVYDKLDAAFSRLVATDPLAWTQRAPSPDKSLANAKRVATSIGGKAGSHVTQEKDEFDEILELQENERKLWK